MSTTMSAFAESRHRDATRSGNEGWRGHNESGQSAQSDSRRNETQRSEVQRSEVQRSEVQRSDRERTDSGQRYDRRNDASRNHGSRHDSYRNNGSRNDSYRSDGYRYDRSRHESYRNDGGRRSYSYQGRVTRCERYNGGYRVWLGSGYPFFISDDSYRHFPIRVGLSIRLGGYWNPLGYYDAYDYGVYHGGAYDTGGDLRGLVESVDYRRGTLVLRDDISGSFVTTVLRGRDYRLGELREGDYVTLTGEWSRNGVFNAYNVADLRDGRYDDRYDE